MIRAPVDQSTILSEKKYWTDPIPTAKMTNNQMLALGNMNRSTAMNTMYSNNNSRPVSQTREVRPQSRFHSIIGTFSMGALLKYSTVAKTGSKLNHFQAILIIVE